MTGIRYIPIQYINDSGIHVLSMTLLTGVSSINLYEDDIMNIIDAIKSGKPFRRPGVPTINVSNALISHNFYKQDLLADNWEIEEEKITITKKELDSACNQVLDYYDFELLAKYLGFKE